MCGACRPGRRRLRREGDEGSRPAGRFPPGPPAADTAVGGVGGAGTPRRLLGAGRFLVGPLFVRSAVLGCVPGGVGAGWG